MKTTIISILLAGILIGGAILLSGGKTNNNALNSGDLVTNKVNVKVIDGKQIIEIDVRGGYSPQRTVAKAGLPTTINFVTSNTFDCSLSLRLPSLGVNKILPRTGSTAIDLGTSTVGQFYGTCGMGMYSFEVDFE